MNRICKGMIKVAALLCALILSAAPVASRAESLLDTRIIQTIEAGDQVTGKFKITLGEGMQVQPEFADGLNKALEALTIEARYAKDGDVDVVDLALLVSDQTVLTGAFHMETDALVFATSALPGKSLRIPYETVGNLAESSGTIALMDAGTQQELEALLPLLSPYLEAAVAWAYGLEDAVISSAEPTPATGKRDAAASSITLRVPYARVKELLSALSERFAQDTALQAQLCGVLDIPNQTMADAASQLAAEVAALEMAEESIEAALYSDANGEGVGIDALIPAPINEMDWKANLTYDRLTAGTGVSRAFRGGIDWNDGKGLLFQLDIRSGEAQLSAMNRLLALQGKPVPEEESLPGQTDSVYFRLGMRASAGDKPMDILELSDEQTVRSDGQKEYFVEELALRVSDTEMPDGGFYPHVLLHVGFSLRSMTEARDGHGFSSESVLYALTGGTEVAMLHWTLESQPYQRADMYANAVLDLSELSEAETQALADELNTGLEQALFQALSLMPPEAAVLFTSGQ